MVQYIDKDALVAEIESMVEKAKAERVLYPNTLLSAKDLLLLKDLEKILSFINTLEVKEVNLPTWKPICSFQYFSDNDIFIEDNCLRWGNMVISLDELKKLPKKS